MYLALLEVLVGQHEVAELGGGAKLVGQRLADRLVQLPICLLAATVAVVHLIICSLDILLFQSFDRPAYSLCTWLWQLCHTLGKPHSRPAAPQFLPLLLFASEMLDLDDLKWSG